MEAVDLLRTTVLVDYGQWYLFDPDVVQEAIGRLFGDSDEFTRAWEQRFGSTGVGACIFTQRRHGETELVVRSLPSPPPPDGADHLVELSITAPGGRLAFSGWETSDVRGLLRVPSDPLRIRIGWFDLTPGVELDEDGSDRFEIDVFPGPAGPDEVLRWFPPWTPKSPEATTAEPLPPEHT